MLVSGIYGDVILHWHGLHVILLMFVNCMTDIFCSHDFVQVWIKWHYHLRLNCMLLLCMIWVCMSCMFLAACLLDCMIDMFLTFSLDCMSCMSCLHELPWNAWSDLLWLYEFWLDDLYLNLQVYLHCMILICMILHCMFDLITKSLLDSRMVWCFDCIIFHCIFDLQSEFIMDIVHFYVWSWIANIDMDWLLMCVACKSWCIFICSDWKYMFRNAAVCWNWWCNQFICFEYSKDYAKHSNKRFQMKPWNWNKECIFISVFVVFFLWAIWKKGETWCFILTKLQYMEWKRIIICFYSFYVWLFLTTRSSILLK